jgi:hypothetical protein
LLNASAHERNLVDKKIRRAAVRAAAAAAGLTAALTLATTPASASGWNVDGWNDHCNYTGYYGCLYYSPNGGGGIFGSNVWISNLDLTSYTFSDSDTNYVWHNAASIANYTTNCGATTWSGKGATGNYNWVHSLKGGNLNSYLRNKEASFDPTASCT